MSVFHPFSCVLGSDHRGLANLGRRSQVSRAEEKICYTAVLFCFICAKFKIGSKRRHLKCAVESLSGGSRDGGASSLRRRITTGEGWLAKSEHFQSISGIFSSLSHKKNLTCSAGAAASSRSSICNPGCCRVDTVSVSSFLSALQSVTSNEVMIEHLVGYRLSNAVKKTSDMILKKMATGPCQLLFLSFLPGAGFLLSRTIRLEWSNSLHYSMCGCVFHTADTRSPAPRPPSSCNSDGKLPASLKPTICTQADKDD